MKTLFNKLMVTLMALTLVFGSTMTAFAAEEEPKFSTDNLENAGQEIPITVEYKKSENISKEDDDTQNKVYLIEIDYDDLNFSFEATKIKWNTETYEYDIKVERNTDPKMITVSNKSNVPLNMNMKIDPNVSGVSEFMDRGFEYISSNFEVYRGAGSDEYKDRIDFWHIPNMMDYLSSYQFMDRKYSLTCGTRIPGSGELDHDASKTIFVDLNVWESANTISSYNGMVPFDGISIAMLSLSFEDVPAEEIATD